MASGDVWDVPDVPVAWTPQGCDQSTLLQCEVRRCREILRAESLRDHMILTHGMIYRDDEDGAVRA